MARADMSQVMERVCQAMLEGEVSRASIALREDYPFVKPSSKRRSIPVPKAMRIFLRDGFIDRYTGDRLVFLPVLRAISYALPLEFPYHPHWKMDECHIAYWQLSATVDHITPIARGGTEDEDNMVTTSMLRNSAKSNWKPEELGWRLHPPGDCQEWDGLVGWFMQYVENNDTLLHDQYLKRWYSTAASVMRKP